MKVTRNTVVTIHYKLTGDDGEIIDESGDEALTYLHGHGQLVPGLETALEGQEPGKQLAVKVEPKDGYGERTGEIVEIPRSEFPEGEIVPGMPIEAVSESGEGITFWVVDESQDSIAVSADHPLAGMTLNFDVNIQDVREATEEEISHDHAHEFDEEDE